MTELSGKKGLDCNSGFYKFHQILKSGPGSPDFRKCATAAFKPKMQFLFRYKNHAGRFQ